jgi:murein DD-endopeptidase MepM/ murein hydrolase activator NlpD
MTADGRPTEPETSTFGLATRRWLLWIAAALVFAASSSPSIAQRVPRLLFPAAGAVGAVLVTAVFVGSLGRLVRNYREGRPLFLTPVVVSLVALVFLGILPAIHFWRAFVPSHDRAPRILARFGDWFGSEGYPLFRGHRGLDIKGSPGSDVLAAADGRVTVARDNGYPCGLIVVIDHDPPYRTVYCHFSEIAVRVGDSVKRGQRIGALGTSGQRAFPGFEHVHLEVQRGRDINALENPLPRIVGCFDETQQYPASRLVLTYPVKCLE